MNQLEKLVNAQLARQGRSIADLARSLSVKPSELAKTLACPESLTVAQAMRLAPELETSVDELGKAAAEDLANPS